MNESKNTSQRSILNSEQKRELEYVKKHHRSKRALLERAYAGKSKAAALKAKCLECSCWSNKDVARQANPWK